MTDYNNSALFSMLQSYTEATTISDQLRLTEILWVRREIFSSNNNKLEILQAESTSEHFTVRNLKNSNWNLLQKNSNQTKQS